MMLADLIGIPFKDRGRNINEGLDCYGLAMEVFRRYGIEIPEFHACCEDFTRINNTIEEQKPLWVSCDRHNPQTPSLVVIRFNQAIFCNHTGVYIGNGKFIHTRQRIGVNIDSIDNIAWKRRIEGFYVPGKEAVRMCNK